MTDHDENQEPQRLPAPEPDDMLRAAESWLKEANLTDEDRAIITSQTADMAAKLSVFSHALASSRASAAMRSHTFLEHIKALLLSPENIAAISDNPHALMELAKMFQRSLESETTYLSEMTDPDRLQALQDARIRADQSRQAKEGEASDDDLKDKMNKIPSWKREKIRSLLDSIVSSEEDKPEEDSTNSETPENKNE